MSFPRRHFCTLLAGALASRGAVPVRQLTQGPAFHWFGYYDKLEFDPTGRFVLSNEVSFEHRSPTEADSIGVGMVDTQKKDRWIPLGRTNAWNWQQGCMLQFVPGSKELVMWNDREKDQFVCRIHNIRTHRTETLPHAIYALSPDGAWGVTTDFRRLNEVRPGYGYAGIKDPNFDQKWPNDIGIWRVDLKTGTRRLLFSLADAAGVANPNEDFSQAKHWFNHLLVSPDSKRIIFLHRWRGAKQGKSFATRMFTINADGTQPYVLDPWGQTSHFVWRDPQHIIAFAWHPSLSRNRFYLYKDRTQEVSAIGPDVMSVNGHCTYLPGNEWILNDTYPDKDRNQNVFLYHAASGKRVELGSFLSPKDYAGEWRCDTHPRATPDGRKVVIDSPHNGGRQMYMLDLSGVL
jgi:hypothetical protein